MKKAPFLLTALLMALAMAAVPLSARAEDEPAAKSEGSDKAPKKESDDGEGKKKPSSGSDVTGGRFEGDPVYVHLSPLVLPVITDAGAEQLVTVAIDVEVKDFDAADRIHSDMPRVMDALMRALYGGLGEGTLRDGKLVNVTKIKAKAQAALVQVMGADDIRDVLIQGVSQRML